METKAPPSSWRQHTFRAMGCEMAVWLDVADDATGAAAFAQAEALFEENEQALSRFRADSDLTRLNALSGQWVSLSGLMWDVLTLALEMAEFTNGWFDPTTLNALEYAGYIVSFEALNRVGRASRPLSPLPLPSHWTVIQLDEARQAILLPSGMHIDLGGIAKGYTAQQVVERLRALGPCLVDAGGDLAAGDAPAGFPGWPVAISAPWSGDDTEPADLCTLWLANQALATSGIDYRTWELAGQVAHHLIDPNTSLPAATDGLTVTVLADDAAQAEAWATATLVAGSKAGMAALLDAELAGLMVTQHGGVLVTPAMHTLLQTQPVG